MPIPAEDIPSNLPVVFQEEKSWGLKTSSSYQYELDGKLSPEDKSELMKLAKKRSGLSASHKQIDHLYELKGRGFVLVIDSSGSNDRVHLRTKTSKKILKLIMYMAAASAIIAASIPLLLGQTTTMSILTSLASLVLSIIATYWGPHSPNKRVKSEERQIVKMIRKIDTLLLDKELNTEN